MKNKNQIKANSPINFIIYYICDFNLSNFEDLIKDEQIYAF